MTQYVAEKPTKSLEYFEEQYLNLPVGFFDKYVVKYNNLFRRFIDFEVETPAKDALKEIVFIWYAGTHGGSRHPVYEGYDFASMSVEEIDKFRKEVWMPKQKNRPELARKYRDIADVRTVDAILHEIDKFNDWLSPMREADRLTQGIHKYMREERDLSHFPDEKSYIDCVRENKKRVRRINWNQVFKTECVKMAEYLDLVMDGYVTEKCDAWPLYRDDDSHDNEYCRDFGRFFNRKMQWHLLSLSQLLKVQEFAKRGATIFPYASLDGQIPKFYTDLFGDDENHNKNYWEALRVAEASRKSGKPPHQIGLYGISRTEEEIRHQERRGQELADIIGVNVNALSPCGESEAVCPPPSPNPQGRIYLSDGTDAFDAVLDLNSLDVFDWDEFNQTTLQKVADYLFVNYSDLLDRKGYFDDEKTASFHWIVKDNGIRLIYNLQETHWEILKQKHYAALCIILSTDFTEDK